MSVDDPPVMMARVNVHDAPDARTVVIRRVIRPMHHDDFAHVRAMIITNRMIPVPVISGVPDTDPYRETRVAGLRSRHERSTENGQTGEYHLKFVDHEILH
jgi:hypothetical protein